MAWTLTTLTLEDRNLVVDTLRKEAERRDKAASTSALQLVTSTEDGRISVPSSRAVRQLHADAETLRSLAWDLEHQRDVPAVVEAAEVLEEERAATYPPPSLVIPPASEKAAQEIAAMLAAEAKPRTTKTRQRSVKLVEFTEQDERAAALAAHPAGKTRTQEDTP